jgi:hypothetical protein
MGMRTELIITVSYRAYPRGLYKKYTLILNMFNKQLMIYKYTLYVKRVIISLNIFMSRLFFQIQTTKSNENIEKINVCLIFQPVLKFFPSTVNSNFEF